MKNQWKLDNFDSEVFGFRVAKIENTDPKNFKNIIKDLNLNKIKYATCRIQSNNFSAIHALEKSGFILVDGLASLGINISYVKMEKDEKEIREANKNDLKEIESLTSGLFVMSRVFNDSLISKNKANEFFVKWIRNSILRKAADSVLVWEENGKIMGYITLQKKGQIPLLGVSLEARGRGIGKKLIKASFNQFKKWNAEVIRVETQFSNIPALRIYQDCGFKIYNSFLTLRWVTEN